MAFVETDCVAEAAQRFLQLLRQHQFVTQQSVGISKARVHLDGPREELDGNVVLSLQTETVSGYTPRLKDTKIITELQFTFKIV